MRRINARNRNQAEEIPALCGSGMLYKGVLGNRPEGFILSQAEESS